MNRDYDAHGNYLGDPKDDNRELREQERNYGLEDEEPKPVHRSIYNDNYSRSDRNEYRRQLAEEKAQLREDAGY